MRLHTSLFQLPENLLQEREDTNRQFNEVTKVTSSLKRSRLVRPRAKPTPAPSRSWTKSTASPAATADGTLDGISAAQVLRGIQCTTF